MPVICYHLEVKEDNKKEQDNKKDGQDRKNRKNG